LKAKISLPFITADASGPKHIEESLSRAKFEQLASKLITRCRPVWDQFFFLGQVIFLTLDHFFLTLPLFFDLGSLFFDLGSLFLDLALLFLNL
jgi:hypothetical protein